MLGRHGILEVLHSDNGPEFSIVEFNSLPSSNNFSKLLHDHNFFRELLCETCGTDRQEALQEGI